jgi:futalosine hydrolase
MILENFGKGTIYLPMRILLAAATIFELRTVIDRMPSVRGVNVDRVITGVGLVSATYHLQKAVSLDPPDLLIQAGIAGCFDPTHPLGSVVVVGEEVIGDQGVEEKGLFKDLFDLSLVRPDSPPYTNGRLINPYADRFNFLGWPVCRGVSVNEISTRQDRITFWNDTYHPLVESMEGAALHFVCLQEKIPFLQVRSISNYIGERDKSKWDIAGAITHLNDGLLELFDVLIDKK